MASGSYAIDATRQRPRTTSRRVHVASTAYRDTDRAQVFYVDLISLECTTDGEMEETQLIDLKNEDNRTAEVTIIDDDEPGVIACARGVPSCP